ncbi:polysaccharide deacetylase family protein [Streptomyces sp. SP18CS02]|uniref:polysaccharide deacetylase family protein n=1 Tax=Streptomyces sp. SP18CS02 TaxID=3002531 RepID=UPI002E780FCC|nr:polysaccharide deacetylase family protein [Streptomyces sp. SP18CS02]MEE1752109.1 polysaccharide deacetylase family protein [Streptomyces sp. SP18CS02]
MRDTNSRVLVAALGVAGATVLAAAWVAQAGPSEAVPAPARKPAPIVGQTSVPDPKLPPPLVSMDIAHASDQGPKGVNITIDDGPDPVWTPKVLQVLEANGVRATFCMVGTQAQAHPDLVKAVVAAGHALCDHSVSHDTTMDKKSRELQAKEITEAERMITNASGGVEPLYYRAPGGAFTPYSRQLAASRGMRPLGWNVDSKDFEKPGADAMVETVKNQISQGPTVLFHDAGGDRGQTVEALRRILPWLKEQGYGFGFPVR